MRPTPVIRRIAPPLLCALLCAAAVSAAPKKETGPPVANILIGRDGTLTYTADAAGNRVPDFSTAGYMAGNSEIPDAPIRVVVPLARGDNTSRIQRAIDYVATLKPDSRGLRGAVLLPPGAFDIAGQLTIASSGVVLRGSGPGDRGTTLVASGVDRRTLIRIKGAADRAVGDAINISDAYVPVGATKFHVESIDSFKVGDAIQVRRPSTAAWIKAVNMADLGGGIGLGWKLGTRDICWDRRITAISGNEITVDAPITTALDATFGGGTVAPYTWPGRIEQVGVENLRCESNYDLTNPKDEAHSWMAITIENAQDAWVRRVDADHFVASAVCVMDSARRVTVQDCKCAFPVSEIAAWRRQAFFTFGQQTLFTHCWGEGGIHDFSLGCTAAGPNAFVQCQAIVAMGFSGPVDSWASGVLFDNVNIDAAPLSLGNRGIDQQFAGWSAANSVLWQCSAALLDLPKPPTAMNWAFGCWGQFSGDGLWTSSNESVHPASLYWEQLGKRLGQSVQARSDWMNILTDASSSPTAEAAARLIAASTQPAAQLADWIDHAGERHPIPIDATGAKSIDDLPAVIAATQPAAAAPIKIENGWLVCGDRLVVGGREEVPWWQGGIRPKDIEAARPSITRYVPGREGPGLTDDLGEVTDAMVRRHVVAMEQHYGLWYDERDDDHERVRRMDGDVWPPFYELPFARSGKGLEWDGLSKYDLTRYNPWFFSRLRQFAELCDSKGLVLINEQFFQHNILEAGAHWASCPWRSANNINDTGFPEPPPYAGDKRIFMAQQFYDVTQPVRRKIFEAYIRKCLDNFVGTSNVIQLTSAEFTGPLHFVQFWIDTIGQWRSETGNSALIGLSAPKDVQDAILADSSRAAGVSLIDIRYWWYQADGKAYAPPGGQNLTVRQWGRVLPHRASSFDQIVRAVSEYREKYPDKAVIYSADGQENGWAVLMGGGSLPEIRAGLDERLLAAIPTMRPTPLSPNKPPQHWMLADPSNNYLVYCGNQDGFVLAMPDKTDELVARWINPRSGEMTEPKPVSAGAGSFKPPGGGMMVLWLSRK